MIKDFVAGLVAPLTKLYANRQERLAAEQAAEDRREEILTEAAAKDSEFAAQLAILNTKNQNNTWKDEYALLVVTAPFVILMLAGLAMVFGAPVDPGALATAMFAPLGYVPEWWTRTFEAAIWTALGINVWKKTTGSK